MSDRENFSRIRLGDYQATDRTRKYMARVLESGRISYGPLCGEFEARFSLMHNSTYGVLSNSGTSSLQVALQALKEMDGWNDGDEVIIPAVTFVATANIVLHNRMTPVFVDVDRDTFAIDPTLIEQSIGPKTRAIIPVHPFGLPCDIQAVCKIAEDNQLRVIEDSAEAMGVSFDRRAVGSWGDIGCFSFYVAHILTTGVGGMSICKSEELSLRMRSLVNHGIEWASLPNAGFYDPSHLGRHFRFESIGHSFRITEMEAALGLAQLDDLDKIIDKRRNNASYLTDKLMPLFMGECVARKQIHKSYSDAYPGHSWMVYPIVSKEIPNHEAISYLRKYGIETREMLPLLRQPCYRGLGHNPDDFVHANEIEEKGYYVPCHQYLTQYEIDYMSQVILSLYGYADPPD